MELQKSHLYAAVLDANGQLIKGQVALCQPRYDPSNPTDRTTQENTGWATFTMSGSSTYHPANGEQGPWKLGAARHCRHPVWRRSAARR